MKKQNWKTCKICGTFTKGNCCDYCGGLKFDKPSKKKGSKR